MLTSLLCVLFIDYICIPIIWPHKAGYTLIAICKKHRWNAKNDTCIQIVVFMKCIVCESFILKTFKNFGEKVESVNICSNCNFQFRKGAYLNFFIELNKYRVAYKVLPISKIYRNIRQVDRVTTICCMRGRKHICVSNCVVLTKAAVRVCQ